MPLDPQVQKFLQQIDQMGLPSLPSLEPAQARVLVTQLRDKNLRPQAVAHVEERILPTHHAL